MNFSGGSYPGWEFSLVGVVWVGIPRGNHLGGNFLGGSFPGTYAQIDKNMLLDVNIYNLIQKAKM